ncbi:MAG TPA: hypothetical protein VGS08_04445 [Candidatus Saccharimonadales bacterium]|nr:hypothetical protein [Candidatus Saccharimonadales bacterium]
MIRKATLPAIIADHNYVMIRDEFCEQLRRSLQDEPTSLPFIRNTLPTTPLVQTGELFQIFVIGGTKGEVATVRADSQGAITILQHKAYPKLAKFKTWDDLLDFIDPRVTSTTRAICLNFGFALVPVTNAKGNLDGIMIGNDTKGHLFRGLPQQPVGAAIEAYFQAKYGRDLVITVGNDVVCLAAAAMCPGQDTALAGIVGTGYNLYTSHLILRHVSPEPK